MLIVATGALAYTGIRMKTNWKKDHVFIELRPIQTPLGWGYDILADGKIFIHQNSIPAVSGGHAFRSKEDALQVGQKVVDRLSLGQIPMVTDKEVREMGIRDSVVSQK
ncbi:DUF4907 domain-containing protein [Flavitalea flava]